MLSLSQIQGLTFALVCGLQYMPRQNRAATRP